MQNPHSLLGLVLQLCRTAKKRPVAMCGSVALPFLFLQKPLSLNLVKDWTYDLEAGEGKSKMQVYSPRSIEATCELPHLVQKGSWTYTQGRSSL